MLILKFVLVPLYFTRLCLLNFEKKNENCSVFALGLLLLKDISYVGYLPKNADRV